MRTTVNGKLVYICLVLALMTSSAVLAIPKPADTTDQIDISKIEESVAIDWPKDDGWKSDWLHRGDGGATMELFFPESQSRNNWTEMITIEITPGKIHPNLPGTARTIFMGTRQGCPDAEWKILEKGDKDSEYPYIVFEIRCLKFLAKQPPETQIWKMIAGKTGLFTVQYSFRGEEIPEDRREEIKKIFDGVHIKTEQTETENEES